MYVNVCLVCGDEFSPIEGNENCEFCSWECEDKYWELEDAKANYNYGRK